MARHKNTAAITTFGDHEVIKPEDRLRKFVSEVPSLPAESDPVACAEKALAELSGNFETWMKSECERLDKARQSVLTTGFTKATKQVLFLAVHDIKGEAATFGYPAVAATADSLCRLLEYTPNPTRIPVELVNQHVDAIRAIFHEYSRSDAKYLAAMLTNRLREVTDEFLVFENRNRPEILKQIAGPSIVPG